MKQILLFLGVITSLALRAQVTENTDFDLGSTCENAIELNVDDESFLIPAIQGQLSLEADKTALAIFQRDLNLTWYRFKVTEDMILGFEITPIERGDNLDFLLFEVDKRKNCPQIYNAQIQPIRKNLAKAQCGEKVSTGLLVGNHGDPFSEPVLSKKGTEYVLVVNNVYNTSGHYIKLKKYKKRVVHGHINAQDDSLRSARVMWVDKYYNSVINETRVDSTGRFSLEAIIDETDSDLSDYEIIIVSPSYKLQTLNLKNETDLQKPVELSLTRIHKGEVENGLGNHIYFVPNSPNKIDEESQARLDMLVKELRYCHKLKVQLEGHSNGVYPSTEIDDILSYSRAQSIKEYLISQGIEPHRIFVKSFGSEKQLYPKARNEEEESKNRRVEIRYLDF